MSHWCLICDVKHYIYMHTTKPPSSVAKGPQNHILSPVDIMNLNENLNRHCTGAKLKFIAGLWNTLWTTAAEWI